MLDIRTLLQMSKVSSTFALCKLQKKLWAILVLTIRYQQFAPFYDMSLKHNIFVNGLDRHVV